MHSQDTEDFKQRHNFTIYVIQFRKVNAVVLKEILNRLRWDDFVIFRENEYHAILWDADSSYPNDTRASSQLQYFEDLRSPFRKTKDTVRRCGFAEASLVGLRALQRRFLRLRHVGFMVRKSARFHVWVVTDKWIQLFQQWKGVRDQYMNRLHRGI